MASKVSNSLPAYQRIQKVIRLRIELGELKPGATVDSERELAKRHKVSLMTARHALAELQREGLVERHPGAGTFVAPPKIHFNKLTSFTENMASRSLSAQSVVLSTSVVDGDHDIAARLALPPGSHLLVIKRIRQAANEPFALETCYLSAEDFADVGNAPLEKLSLFALLERSRCYQESGTMTCVTCHDVHQPQRDAAAFSQRCLSCHQVQSCGRFKTLGSQIAGRCVDCHMPLQTSNLIVSDANGRSVRPKVRNHWIKIYSDAAR